MTQGIGWSVSAWIEGGPTTQATGVVEVDAYDRISATVAAGTTVKVSVAPGTWADVSLLVIRPSVPDGSVTYSFKSGGPQIALDATHSLIGAGAVSLFGGGNAELEFTGGGADATVDILLGRDATP
jgi:hypothetical protein